MISVIKKTIARTAMRLGYRIHRYVQPTEEQLSNDDPFRAQAELLASHGQSPLSIFDVGANRGQTALAYFKLFPTAKIYSFEPTPEMFDELKATVVPYPTIHPFQSAISDRIGQAEFFRNPRGSVFNSLLPNNRNGLLAPATGSNAVETTTLDHFASANEIDSIDILKLDIQGAELKALEGSRHLLTEQRIGLVFLEVIFAPMYNGQPSFRQVSSLLHRFGFATAGIYQIAAPQGIIGWADVLFVNTNRFPSF